MRGSPGHTCVEKGSDISCMNSLAVLVVLLCCRGRMSSAGLGSLLTRVAMVDVQRYEE